MELFQNIRFWLNVRNPRKREEAYKKVNFMELLLPIIGKKIICPRSLKYWEKRILDDWSKRSDQNRVFLKNLERPGYLAAFVRADNQVPRADWEEFRKKVPALDLPDYDTYLRLTNKNEK